MLLNKLSAISPVDGRYRPKTKSLSPYFSEFGLIQYRVRIEVEYFIALCELPLPELKDFPTSAIEELRSVYIHFNLDQAQAIMPPTFWLRYRRGQYQIPIAAQGTVFTGEVLNNQTIAVPGRYFRCWYCLVFFCKGREVVQLT